MHELIQYVAAHPIVLVILVSIVIGIIFSLVKKVLKVAVVLLLVFVTVSAVFYYFADKEWARKGKELLETTTKKAEEVITKEGKKLYKEGLKVLEDSSATEDTSRTAAKHPSKSTKKKRARTSGK